MVSSRKEICPICGLGFYDLDFHIVVDEECPEVAKLRHPKYAAPDVTDRLGPLSGGFFAGSNEPHQKAERRIRKIMVRR